VVKQVILKLIRLYQKTISFDHGPLKKFFPVGYCKFSPTCSMYMYTAINRFGVIKGGWLGIKRIVRCNPYSRGGLDQVPVK
jgi:putative membrane protein insertion efficiency factor